MMRAVWSFWTKPFKAHHHTAWPSPLHHLLSWVLSVEMARQHYPRTALVTDDEGARLLVDQLGLNFDEVSTGLNALDGHDPGWWALGKVYAYRAQREPFIHIDNDAFLWKPLPEQVTSSPVFAQCPEHDRLGFYHPEVSNARSAMEEQSGFRRSGSGIARTDAVSVATPVEYSAATTWTLLAITQGRLSSS